MSRTITGTITQTWTGIPTTVTWTPTRTYTFTASASITVYITHTGTPDYTATVHTMDNIKIYDIILYPNPVAGDSDINIRFSSNRPPEKTTIEIYTMAFRKVYEQTSCDTVDNIVIGKEKIAEFSNGVYFYRLKISKKDNEALSAITPFLIIKKR